MFALQGLFLIEIVFNGNPIVLFYNSNRRQSLRCGANAKKKTILVQVFLLEHFVGVFFYCPNPAKRKWTKLPSMSLVTRNVKGRCACEIIYGSPERQKKILFERLFSRNKKINALTEVKENQYLTASGIKFFQKQTAGNNCPVCMTDLLNVGLRTTEIRFA